MFTLLKEIHHELKTTYPDVKTCRNPKNPSTFAYEILKMLAHSVNLKKEIRITLIENPFESLVNVTKLSSEPFFRIGINPYLLINTATTPKPFRFRGSLDSRLKKCQSIQNFSNWLCQKFSLPQHQITRIDRLFLRCMTESLKNREMAKKAIKFTFLHELGHIALEHIDHPTPNPKRSFLYKIINIFCLGLLNRFSSYAKKMRAHELQADRFAARASKDCIQGGLYLFKTMQSVAKQSLLERILLFIPRLFASFSPSIDSRIQNLKTLQF